MKKSFYLKNNEKLIDNLKESLEYNLDALDYIVEKKRVAYDSYKLTDLDIFKAELKTLEYIEFVLNFVGYEYQSELSKKGVSYG